VNPDLRTRLGGLLSIAIAAGAAWFAILTPLRQARAGAPEVSMMLRAAYVLLPFTLVFRKKKRSHAEGTEGTEERLSSVPSA
jgi:hypothetical protein